MITRMIRMIRSTVTQLTPGPSRAERTGPGAGLPWCSLLRAGPCLVLCAPRAGPGGSSPTVNQIILIILVITLLVFQGFWHALTAWRLVPCCAAVQSSGG